MIITFVLGLAVAGIGIIISSISNNWQISFIISGAVSAVALVIASMIANISFILKKKRTVRSEESTALKEGERLARAITVFASPNVIMAVILYFKLYR